MFYPVTSEGVPLGAGEMINLNGEFIDKIPEDGKYGTITYDGTNYGVLWNNQVVGYSSDKTPTWTGKFYVKTKEDFLGGNTVNTNKDKDANNQPLNKFTPQKYVIDDQEYPLHTGDDTKLTRTFETPYVNVDELSLTNLRTEWTVYYGTEVTPIEQLKELLKSIDVREVVSASTNHMITEKEAMLGTSDTESSEIFSLYDYIGDLTDEQWEGLMGIEDEFGNVTTTPVEISYSKYGQQNKGTITISLSDKGHYSDYNTHPTEEVGSMVEDYTLTVSYIPTPADTSKNYHTTVGGNPGEETGRMRSVNIHAINVYAKKLKIVKVDQADACIDESPATFELYRNAVKEQDEESDYAENVPECLPDGDYIFVDTYITEDGVVVTDEISKMYEYFLVETKAPGGYYLPSGYFKVSVDTDNQSTYTTIHENPARTSNVKWDPWVLSGWEEKSTVILESVGEGMDGYVKYGTGDGTAYTYDMLSNEVEWKIRNDAGFELPATGGPGTRHLTAIGIVMAALASLMLLRRKMTT